MKKLILSALAFSLIAAPAMAGSSSPSTGTTGVSLMSPVVAVDMDKANLSVAGGNNSFNIRGGNSINLVTSNNGNALTAQIINDSPFHLAPLNAGVEGDLGNTPFNVSTVMAYSHFEKPQFNFNKLSGDDTTTTTTTSPGLPAIDVNVTANAEANTDAGSSSHTGASMPVIPFSLAIAGASAGFGAIDPALEK